MSKNAGECVLMTLRYENKKEYQGYSRDTILTFSDDELLEENYPSIKKKLKKYHGNKGEVIEIKIIYDKKREASLIFLIIICFNTILNDVSDYSYSKFTNRHKIKFMDYYQRIDS